MHTFKSVALLKSSLCQNGLYGQCSEIQNEQQGNTGLTWQTSIGVHRPTVSNEMEMQKPD